MITHSIIQKFQLEGATRLDAEYYQPEYLTYLNKIRKFSKPLTEFVKLIKHPAEIERIYEESGVPFLLTQNISPDLYILQFDEKRFIRKEDAEKIPQNKLLVGDTVMTRTGANYGDAAVYLGDPSELFASAHVLIIRPKNVTGEFLATFLRSKIGRALVKRGVYGTSQPEISPEYLKTLLIPFPNQEKLNLITENVRLAHRVLKDSKSLYSQAEELLLRELGLKDFEAEEELSCIVNLTDVKSVNRADAEYFQRKYNKVEKILNGFRRERLEDVSSLISYGTVPTSPYVEKEGVAYIKGENLKNCFIDYSKLVYLEAESTKLLPKKYYLKRGDIIISQMGTVGRAGLVTKQEEGWLFASFTIRVRLKEESKAILNPLFVTLFIENISRPYYPLRRISQASVRQNTDLPTIKDLKVPILPKPTQDKIADLVYQSHQARKKAKELLEKAKREVEELIERGQSYS